MARFVLLACAARALTLTPSGQRLARWSRARGCVLRRSSIEDGDGVDLRSSDSFDVLEDEWDADEAEADAAVEIHRGVDDAENALDPTYFFGSEGDDDAELRALLGELEEQFAGKADAASASILESVRSCSALLDAEGDAADLALDARAALAFAATARGDAPEDEAAAPGALDDALTDAFARLEDADPVRDEMYGWFLGNASDGGGAVAWTPSRTRPAPAIGIDLGTTNSAAAVVDDDGVARLLPPGLVPSVVGFLDPLVEDDAVDLDAVGRVALRDDDGQGVVAVVGADAERLRASAHAASVCSRVKRVLARDATRAERRRVGVLEDEKHAHAVTLKVPALPTRIAAAEVSAEVVRKLREDAAALLGPGAATRAVVGVPARFDAAARAATVTAGTLGGFADVRLIEEPVAAALAYGNARGAGDGKELVLVFDLGGGTFDSCVVELSGTDARLVAIGGDAKLGGDDFDAALAEHLADRFYDAHGVAVAAPTAQLRLLAEAERLKRALSVEDATTARAAGLARVGADGTRKRGGRPLDLDAAVTRRAFEALCAPLLERLETTVAAVCRDAGVALPGALPGGVALEEDGRPLDSVLLVGGATRMPAVGRLLRRLTGLPLAKIAANADVHPDEAVALGAALYAATLDSQAGVAGAREAEVQLKM